MSLTERQQRILKFIQKNGPIGNQDVVKHIGSVSRITVIRDIKTLLNGGYISKEGVGRSTYYREIAANGLGYIDVESYFQNGPDERTLKNQTFSFEVFENFSTPFTQKELRELEIENTAYQKRLHQLPSHLIRKEFERLTIELSWKSSHIEGNTYSLIDTEALIKKNQEAQGHSHEEAVMILNHKKALDYIHDMRSDFKRLTLSKIERIHDLVIYGLNVPQGIRRLPVAIIGTTYRPLDNEHQIRDAIEMLILLVNKMGDPFTKALISIVFLSYIQPFLDGNKRTARLLGNAILLAYDACPLSYRSINETEYKKSLILFYEQNNIRYFKELFKDQFFFSTSEYFTL